MDADTTRVESGNDPAMGDAGMSTENTPQFESDADRWKFFSRQNEQKWKKASEELEAAKAKTGELASTISEMREEHSLNLASIELKHQASLRGIELDADVVATVNLPAFLNEDSGVDLEKVTNFLNRFGSPKSAYASSTSLGIGRTGGTSPTPQVSLDGRARR